MPLVSIIIPVYNEEKSIIDLIERLPNTHIYEIILVDDGSTDNSFNLIKKLGKNHIKIIKHERNKGYGEAILTGFKYAKGEIIVTMDSDGQHNPEEIPKLIKPIIKNRADLVIGSRYLGKCSYKVPIYIRIGEYFIKICFLTIFHQIVGNNQSGFRAFKKENIKLLKDMKYNGMGFTTELLFKFALSGFKILEIPINLNSRKYGRSYVNLIRLIKSIIVCISIYYLKKNSLDVNRLFLKKWLDLIYKKIKYLKIFNERPKD